MLDEVETPRLRSGQQELPRKNICLQFAPFLGAIIFYALQAYGSGLAWLGWIDVVSRAVGRYGVKFSMADLMGSQRGALADVPPIGATNRPRSLIVDAARALQRRVAQRQPGEHKIEMPDG